MKTIEDVSLKDILPDSISKDKNVNACSEAIDTQLKAIALNVDIPTLYTKIDKLESLALDHLAKQYDITPYRDNWNIELKRNVIKRSIADKRKKGTLGAVKKAVESLGASVSIIEWWQTNPKGEPHTFKINVVPSLYAGVVSSEMQEDIMTMIDEAKPLRSHYDFTMQDNLTSAIGLFGYLRPLTIAKLRTDNTVISKNNADGAMYTFAAARAITKRHLIGEAK